MPAKVRLLYAALGLVLVGTAQSVVVPASTTKAPSKNPSTVAAKVTTKVASKVAVSTAAAARTTVPPPTLHPRHWGYKNISDEIEPGAWGSMYPKCAGTRQSPVQIDSKKAVKNMTMGPLVFMDYDQHASSGAVINNGHGVQFSGDFARTPVVEGGGLGDEYEFMQYHFHWGSSDAGGSEHIIDGRRFPLELHLVHRRIEDSEATMGSDPVGIAVIAVLFQLAPKNAKPSTAFEALTVAVQSVLYQDETLNVTLPKVELVTLLPPRGTPYYRYMGSLTTPPCAEAVIWTVMATPLNITETQLVRFRKLHDRHRPPTSSSANSSKDKVAVSAGKTSKDKKDAEENDQLADNNRAAQPLNGRVIQYYPGATRRTAQGPHPHRATPHHRQWSLKDYFPGLVW